MLEGVWGRSKDREAESGAAARSERAAHDRETRESINPTAVTAANRARQNIQDSGGRHTEAGSTVFGIAGACRDGHIHRYMPA